MAIPTEKPSFGVLDDVKVVFAAMEEAVPRACNRHPARQRAIHFLLFMLLTSLQFRFRRFASSIPYRRSKVVRRLRTYP